MVATTWYVIAATTNFVGSVDKIGGSIRTKLAASSDAISGKKTIPSKP
jgi:hypothetical protein